MARNRKLTCQFVADKGKGSHGRLYFGDEFTILKDRKKEIGRDLLAKMWADLKIDPHDLWGKDMSPSSRTIGVNRMFTCSSQPPVNYVV